MTPRIGLLSKQFSSTAPAGGSTAPDHLHATINKTLDADATQSGVASSLGNQGALSFLQPSDDPAYLGRLDHFEIARIIGRGGMGIVLEAFDTHLQRQVAIKVLNPEFAKNDVARKRSAVKVGQQPQSRTSTWSRCIR